MLLSDHCHVGKALDGDVALEECCGIDPPPAVILIGHQMPNMSGIRYMKEIFKINPSGKIIFVSANVDAKDDLISEVARAFFVKPCRVS